MVSCRSRWYIPLMMSDKGTQPTSHNAESTTHSYLHGLRASVRNNTSAYGFWVTITATMALLNSIRGTPTALEIVAFCGRGGRRLRFGGTGRIKRLHTRTGG
jgi:hypothetical protein